MPVENALSISATMLTGPLKPTLGYAEALLADISPDTFAHMPHPTMNHPAFCLGHLSLYPNRAFILIGRPELAVERAGFDELFKAGVACVEQDGRYPAKDAIVEYYFERYRAAAKAVESLEDASMAMPNPIEGRMRELFPTVGEALNFLLLGHNMMHLGQISAWRRAMGMGSAM